MAKKKLSLAELREHRDDTDQSILQVRKILEAYQTERTRLFSPENRRRLSEQGLKEDELKLRAKTEPLLAARNARIAQLARESFEHRDTWTREYTLRHARFAPESNGNPGTPEAEQRAFNREMLEELRRGNAERRAMWFTPEDLATETALAAEAGKVAQVAVYLDAARQRRFAGVEKLAVDQAGKKLQLPEIDEAQTIYAELEGLAKEADALFTLWKNPTSTDAQTSEQLGRFDRKKRAERLVQEVEELGKQRDEAKVKAEAEAA